MGYSPYQLVSRISEPSTVGQKKKQIFRGQRPSQDQEVDHLKTNGHLLKEKNSSQQEGVSNIKISWQKRLLRVCKIWIGMGI